mgnify:CR=1 FL=1
MSKNLTAGILKPNPLELRDNGTYVCEYRLLNTVTKEVISEFNYDSARDIRHQITYSKINMLAFCLGIKNQFYYKVEETVITYLQAKAIASFIIEEQKIINEHTKEGLAVPESGGFWALTDGEKLYFNDSSVDGSMQQKARLFLFISNGIGHKELFKEVFAGLKRIK